MKVTVSDNSISTLASGMNSPRACTLGSSGAIVVADTDNNAVKRINTDGTVDSIGSIGSIFSKPTGIAIDSSNNIFIADSGSRRILKIDSLGTTSTFASKLGVLNGIAVHPPSGSIITADSSYNVIRKISENFVGGRMIERTIGSIFTMDSLSNFFIAVPARNTVTKFTLSGAATTYVGFSNPQGLTVDSSNNVYVSNLGTKTIIKIAASDGTLSTYATDFNGPTSISMDGSNNLYVADKNNNNGFIVIKKISSSGVITTVLDNYISILNHLVADSAGNLYFSARLDFTSNGIHKRTTDGTVSNIASDFFSISSLSVDNSGNLYIANPDIIQLSSSGGRKTLSSSMAGSSGIVVDTSGNVFVANEGSNSIFKIEPPLLSISTLATLNCYANQGQCNFFNTPNVQELYSSPSGIDADSAGSLFVADTWNDRISKVDASTGTVSTYSTGFIRPRGVAVDAAGKVYVADTGNNAVKTIATDGTVNTLATGFNFPSGLCVDSSGTVYVADTNNNAVKRIATDGTVSSINSFVMWDGTFSTNFGSPQDVAIDSLGNVWVARVGTYGNGGIMKVKADGSSSAIVFDGSSSYSAVTLGPAGSVYGVTGDIVKKITSDGVVSNLATLPSSINSGMSGGIAVDPLGKIYASVFSTHQIQKITPPGPTSQVLKGLSSPEFIAIDASGNTFVSDSGFVRKITPSNVMTTIGSGFNLPRGVCVDSNGNVIIADSGTSAVKKISSDGTIISIGSGFSSPTCVAVDLSSDTVYVCDSNAIKKVAPLRQMTDNIFFGVSPRGICVDPVNGNVLFSQSSSVSRITSSGSGLVTIATGFSDLRSLSIDSFGRIFVADNSNVKMIFPDGRVVSVVIGMNRPSGIAFDISGSLFISDTGTKSIEKVILPEVFTSGLSLLDGISVSSSGDMYVVDRKSSLKKVSSSGTITTISNSLINPRDVDIDSNDNVYISVQSEVKKITSAGIISTLASDLSNPTSLTYHQSSGSVFFSNANSVMKISSTGVLSTVGSGFSTPSGIALDSSNNVYVADSAKGKIMKISASSGMISTYYAGLNFPTDIVCDSAGSLWIVDSGMGDYKNFFFLKRVASDGSLSYFARSPFNQFRISLGTGGNLFISESKTDTIKTLTPSAGMISIMNSGSSILIPQSIDIDPSGTVFFADVGSSSIKKIATDGSVSTISFGIAMPSAVVVDDTSGVVYFADKITGDIGKIPAGGTSYSTFASGFTQPSFLVLDSYDNIYVTDAIGLKKITPLGDVSLLAVPGSMYTGLAISGGAFFVLVDSKLKKVFSDGLVSTILGSLNSPEGLSIDSVGNCYFMDTQGLKRVSLDGETTTVVTTSLSSSGLRTMSELNGNIFIADRGNNAIVKVMFKFHFPVCDSLTWHHIAQVYEPDTFTLTAYLDGKLFLQRPALIVLPSRSSSSLRIGWSGENSRKSLFSGSLADLRMYGRALSSGEVEILSLPSSGAFPNDRLQQSVSMSPDGTAFWFSCANGAAGPLATLSKTLTNSYLWTSSPSCVQCTAGTWAQRGSSTCVLCPPGTYSLSGASSCTPCPINTYNSKVGASSLAQCLACPAASTSTSGSTTCDKTLQVHDPLLDPSSCQLRLFPSSDLAGDRLTDLATASETDCSRACCKNSTCIGYAYVRTLQICTLLSNITYVIPSSFISGGVRDSALWL